MLPTFTKYSPHLFHACSWCALLIALAFAFLFLTGPAAAEPSSRYVDGASGLDSGFCDDPSAPCATINYAIGQSGDGDTILIAGGEYRENVKLVDGLARTITGSYANNNGQWTTAGEATVIHGQNADTTIEIRNQSDTRIELVRVTGGMGQEDATFGNGCGGFKIQNSDVEIVRAGIRQNTAGTGDGGGICARGEEERINLLLDKVFVGGNRAVNSGGGMQLFNTNTTIINSVFTNNSSASNVANVMLLEDDNVTIINSTIANNNRNNGDQAILLFAGSLTMSNSIMWENALNLQADPPCDECFDVTYSDIEQPTPGTGNISADPLFANMLQRIFRLRPNSPCINSGTADGAPVDDLRDNPRDSWPDMGAFEHLWPDHYLPLMVGE